MRSADRKLRAVLRIAAAVCGLAVIGVVAPWSWLERWIEVQYGVELATTDELRAELDAEPAEEATTATPESAAAGTSGPGTKDWRSLELVMGKQAREMFEYCLRVGCAVCALVGVYFLLLASRPSRYRQFLDLGIAGLIGTGLVAIIAGVALELAPRGYLADVLVLWALGFLLLAWSRESGTSSRRSSSRRRKQTDSSQQTGEP